jgi:hypothetical protein
VDTLLTRTPTFPTLATTPRGMPDDFPRIEVSEREDVHYLFDLIRKHAIGLVEERLTKDGTSQNSKALRYCEKAVDTVSDVYIYKCRGMELLPQKKADQRPIFTVDRK